MENVRSSREGTDSNSSIFTFAGSRIVAYPPFLLISDLTNTLPFEITLKLSTKIGEDAKNEIDISFVGHFGSISICKIYINSLFLNFCSPKLVCYKQDCHNNSHLMESYRT